MSEKNDKHKDKKSDEVIDRKPKFFVKTAADLQKLRLEKLMKNPDKQIIIPEKPRDKDFTNAVPVFVRNVMGSSAGAGSGEFHVYRNLRRKEYARLKTIDEKGKRERMDDDYHQKLEKNKQDADEKTAKKRAKRLKKKQNSKNKPKINKSDVNKQVHGSRDDESSENSDEIANSSSQSDNETESKCNEEDNNTQSNILIEKSNKMDTEEDKLSKCDEDATTKSSEIEEIGVNESS